MEILNVSHGSCKRMGSPSQNSMMFYRIQFMQPCGKCNWNKNWKDRGRRDHTNHLLGQDWHRNTIVDGWRPVNF